MRPVGGERDVAELYRDWALTECDDSPTYRTWALGVAADRVVRDLVGSLPAAKRQPNLVLAAARWNGAEPGPYDELRRVLTGRWDDVRATVLARATQTNEVGRCATLLPVLAALPGPLALLEVGCSAGLCLFPDRYGYHYTSGDGAVTVQPDDGPSSVRLTCAVEGPAPLPGALPEVVWRGGVDLNPLDVRDLDAMRWLQMLVWPEHDDRRARLAAAVEVVREEPPARIVRGDLRTDVAALAAQAPAGATLVVFHSAVLAYLDERDRMHVAASMADLPGHWLSNEGPSVLPEIAASAGEPPHPGSTVGRAPFVLGLDGHAVGWTHGHGRGLAWLGGL